MMSKKKCNAASLWIGVVLVGLVCLSLLAIVKTLFVSIDIDESYAVSQAFRLLKGDRMIADMWEPHQFSGYMTAIFLKLHILIFGGTDYAIIGLRVWGTLIHLLLGYIFYQVICNWSNVRFSLFACIIHVNFLAKWIQLPEFELMHYWMLVIAAVCFWTYYVKGKGIYLLVIAGGCMMLQLLNYPTMILLYPFYMLGIFFLSGKAVRWRDIFITTLSAVIPGLAFLAYLLSYQSLSEFMQNLSYVLADPSHTGESFGWRMWKFGKEFGQDVLLLVVVVGVCCLLILLGSKIRKKVLPKKRHVLILSMLGAFMLLCLWQMVSCVLFDQNQFYLQERYLLLAVLGVVAYFVKEEKGLAERLMFWFGLLPSFISTIAAALLTNMSMNVSYSKLFLAGLVTFILLYLSYEEQERMWLYMPMLCLLGSLLVCKLVLIRVTGCAPVTVRAPLQQMQNGPLKGVYILEDLAAALESDQKLLKQYVTEEDNLFIFGCESLLYVGCEAQISVASVQGTSVFNEDFLEYLELHPEKYPTVVAVDKRFPEVWEYRYNPWNYFVADWIEKEYEYSEKVETEYMILYIQ